MSTRKNLTESIQTLLQALATNSYIFQSGVAARYHFHSTDLLILHVLSWHDALTAGALAEKIHLTSGATTVAIDRLAAMGYVERKASLNDRRKVYIQLNPAKSGELKELYEPIDNDLRHHLQQYTTDELEVIAAFLSDVTGGR